MPARHQQPEVELFTLPNGSVYEIEKKSLQSRESEREPSQN